MFLELHTSVNEWIVVAVVVAIDMIKNYDYDIIIIIFYIIISMVLPGHIGTDSPPNLATLSPMQVVNDDSCSKGTTYSE